MSNVNQSCNKMIPSIPCWVLVLCFGVCISVLSCSNHQSIATTSMPDEESVTTTSVEFPVTIHKPSGPPTVNTDVVDRMGHPVTVACSTCHTTRPPNRDAQLGHSLTMFHQTISGAHGKLNCVACHNPDEGYQALRLADGRSLPYTEVMQLCAQCHGPQYRDYQHGAHGGMNGYWDLNRGGRTRNNCVDCHHPHAPKFRTFMPAPGPQDQGFNQKGGGHE